MNFWPVQADAGAKGVDQVTLLVLSVCTLLAVGVFLVVAFFLVRYREGSSANRDNPPEQNMKLELSWLGGALVLSMIMFFSGASAYYNLYVPPPNIMEIEVVGKQWMWKIRHPDGRKEINTLHLPVGTKVRLNMISEDVIHSFYLPQFRTKHDVLPGRYTSIWIEPEREGEYELFCSEYCGTEHSRMGGKVVVMSGEDYARWAVADAPLTPEQRGRNLYQKFACASCHDYQSDSQPIGAPQLDGFWGKTVGLEDGSTARVDEEYVRRSILRPNAQIVSGFEPLMPTYQDRMTEDEMLDLIAYLRSRTGQDTQQ